MPVIMKEGVQYAYTEDAVKAHTLSLAEYNALTEAEKMNGDLYLIPDKQPDGTNPASRIDDLEDEVSELKSNINNKLTYNLLGEIHGSAEMNLPSDWKEMIVQVVYNGTNITSYFLSDMFYPTNKMEVSLGNYGTSYAIGRISKSAILISNVTWGGTSVTSQVITYIYYR